MNLKYILFGIEIFAIIFSIIFPDIIPLVLIGMIIGIASVFFPRILPTILIILMGFHEILPGINLGKFSLNPSQMLILLALFYIFLDVVYTGKNKFQNFNNIFAYLIIAFYFFCFISIIPAIDKTQSIRYLRDLFFYIAMAFVIVYWIKDYGDFEKVLSILKYTGLVVAFLGILQLIFKIDYDILVEDSWWGVSGKVGYFRIKSTFRDPNFLSNFLLLPFFIAFSGYIAKKKLNDFLVSFIIFLAIMFTNSRSAFLAFFIGLVIYFAVLHLRKGAIFKYFLRLIFVFSVIVVLFFLMPTEYLDRWLNPEYGADWSSIYRVYYIIISFKIIFANMLWGIGINNFPLVLKTYTPKVVWESLMSGGNGRLAGGGYAHNTFLTIWAETGTFNAIVLVLFVLFAIYLLLKISRQKYLPSNQKYLFSGVIIGFLTIIIQIFTITYISFHTLISMGLIVIVYKFFVSKKNNAQN
jgi:O-Antigen ligase